MGLIFEVVYRDDGTMTAICPAEGITTGGDDLEDLHVNINSAIDERFEGRERPHPSRVRLLVTSE